MKTLLIALFAMIFVAPSTSKVEDDCDDWTTTTMKREVKSQMWEVLRCHSDNRIFEVEIDDIEADGDGYDFEGTYEAEKSSGAEYDGTIEGHFVLDTNGWGECKLKIKRAYYERGFSSGSLGNCL